MSTATKTKTKSPLPWFGSDASVAADLGAMLDHCKHVTIPFCGGMSILPHLKASHVVANDLNGAAMNFYRVASGVYGAGCQDALFRRCQTTLSHPATLREASGALCAEAVEGSNPTSSAWAYWAICWLGRKGRAGTHAEGTGEPSVRWNANGGANASRVRSAADDLPAWAQEFTRCDWCEGDWWDVVDNVSDEPDCGLFVDSPWFGAGSAYIHSFASDDPDDPWKHYRDLAAELQRFEDATVIIRYDDHPMARELYGHDHWRIIEATSRTQANKKIGELWITNRRAS